MTETKEKMESIYKQALGSYPTGVAIITTVNEEGSPLGLTVNSFASVSLNPPLILWSIDHRSSAVKSFVNGNKFAVHIMAADQEDICKTFAFSKEDKFKQCSWSKSEYGLPIIDGATAVLQCKVHETIEAGDHTILIGMVIDTQAEEKEPILYHKRTFGAIPNEFYVGS